MNFIELTHFYDGNKFVLNFNIVERMYEYDGKLFVFTKTGNDFAVKESLKDVEKLLNETSHFVKRAYKPEL